LSKRKNQLSLIKKMNVLIKNNNSIQLLLPGRDELNGKCQKLVDKLGINNNIHFLGYRSDINKLLKISNLAISFSKQEGLPMNILEALTAKLPVIATDCRGHRDLINNKVNGYLLNLNNTKCFIEYVNKIMRNDNLKNNISENNINESKKYNHQNINNEIIRIYDSKRTELHESIVAIDNSKSTDGQLGSYEQ